MVLWVWASAQNGLGNVGPASGRGDQVPRQAVGKVTSLVNAEGRQIAGLIHRLLAQPSALADAFGPSQFLGVLTRLIANGRFIAPAK